jgi:hypothetical protein
MEPAYACSSNKGKEEDAGNSGVPGEGDVRMLGMTSKVVGKASKRMNVK